VNLRSFEIKEKMDPDLINKIKKICAFL